MSLWLLLLWKSPLTLLAMNEGIQDWPQFKLPAWMGGMEVSLPQISLVGFFHYHPRVLDGWVTSQITVVQDSFRRITTVRDREVNVETPIALNGKLIMGLEGHHLRETFRQNRACLLIWGEGGAGKTSLACQIARWAMSEEKAVRPCAHRMLPILIEDNFDFDVSNGKNLFTEVISGQLRNLLGSSEAPRAHLVEQLLRRQRILVIVDGLSELNETTRNRLRPVSADFPANALVITSRRDESLDGAAKTALHPMRIQGNRLSSFVEGYLRLRGKRDLFDDAEFFNGCSKLTAMVGERDTTVLLAKLYVEQMVASKARGEVKLPENVPDLMLEYLNEINRKEAKHDDRTVQTVAKTIAWECIRQTFHPTPARIDEIVRRLGGGVAAEEKSRYLEDSLRLAQTVGVARDRVKLGLDPLAEYLAGLWVIENYGDDERLWRDLLAGAEAVPGSPETIKGFLTATLDCCLSKGSEAKVPTFVTSVLSERVKHASGE
jgi:hypothetical protein